MDNFVVYAYVRSGPDRFGRMGTFYYIGKGKPGRPFDSRNRVGAKTPQDEKNIVILHKDLPEDLALDYEKRLILFYGRIDLYPEWGILRNLTDGGEGVSGLVRSEEYKNKKSAYFDLYHPEHGEFKNTNFNKMSKMFPEIFKSRSSVLQIISGQYLSYKGWVLLSNKDLVHTPKSKKKLENTFNWHHCTYGEVLGLSVKGLIEKFPDLKLDKSNLYLLTWRKKKVYRGWTILENEGELVIDRGSSNKSYSWFHPNYGSVKASQSELIKKFPDQNLDISLLSRVVNKRAKTHKGWTLSE